MRPSILVAVDGTRGAVGALRMVRILAERESAEVELLAVYNPPGLCGVAAQDPAVARPLAVDEGARTLRRRIHQQLASLGRGAESWPVTLAVGNVAASVAARAEARGVGRVVLGLSQADLAERWAASEILLDLIRRLQVPVLAVPPGFGDLPQRVIVAVDFSRYSLEIAREALEDLEPGAQLHLVYVAQSASQVTAGARPVELGRIDRLAIERQLTELASELEIPGIAAVETHLLAGDPADEILRLAEDVGAELIAAGSHGASYPGQLLTGDVYEKLVHGATCSLLIGPPRGMRTPGTLRSEDSGSLQPIVA